MTEGEEKSPKKCANFLQSSISLWVAIVAMILSVWPTMNCEMVKFTTPNDDIVLFVGPLAYQVQVEILTTTNEPLLANLSVSEPSDECRTYDRLRTVGNFEYETDLWTSHVWAFSIIAPLLGGVVVYILVFMLAKRMYGEPCKRPVGTKWLIGCLLLCTSVCQGLVLMIVDSSICHNNPVLQFLEGNNTTDGDATMADMFNPDCELAKGYYVQIAATVLWAVAGFCEILVQDPYHRNHYQEENKKIKEEQLLAYPQIKSLMSGLSSGLSSKEVEA